jgi:hypothetical protein
MKTIKTEGNAKIVEENNNRFILPVGSDDLAMAIPYGLPWEEFVNHPAIPEKLRQAGIYTFADLIKRPEAALGAIQAAYGMDLQQLIILARNYGGK